MKIRLNSFQKQLCNLIQLDLPVCDRPFLKIAQKLQVSEQKVLKEIKSLQSKDVIRRLYPIINYKTIGITASLAAAHVPPQKLAQVVKAVNSINAVSHNYLRDNYYNMWFTLTANSKPQLCKIIKELSQKFKIECHSLPTVREFKRNLQFDISNKKLLTDKKSGRAAKKTSLTETDIKILQAIQSGIKIQSRPFENIAQSDRIVIQTIKNLKKIGVIKRISAVLNLNAAGLNANTLIAMHVPKAKIIAAGTDLSKLYIISHCYQRKTFKGWNYNLYAMAHAENIITIQKTISDFCTKHKIKNHTHLKTLKELKKQPVVYF